MRCDRIKTVLKVGDIVTARRQGRLRATLTGKVVAVGTTDDGIGYVVLSTNHGFYTVVEEACRLARQKQEGGC